MSELDVIQGFFKKEQKDKIDKYRILNETVVKGQILFTGSSLMEQFSINELLMTEKMDYIINNQLENLVKIQNIQIELLGELQEQLAATSEKE